MSPPREWYTPKASSHVFDPYSFCLVVAGLILHLTWGSEDFNTWILGFLAALGLELAWEIIGNTPLVLARIRSNNGTCGEYAGNKSSLGSQGGLTLTVITIFAR